jgi:endonuclease/exonuclease/phosphatase family metal-dependent hydrolase
LPDSQEIYIDAQSGEDTPEGAVAPLLSNLDSVKRLALRVPGVHRLRHAVEKGLAVVEPAGRLSIIPVPERRASHNCEGLTILSANLWHDWPRHRRIGARLEDFARIAEAHRADILLLQEVARTPDLSADKWLSERLGMAAVYSRANGNLSGIGFEEGLAIFSRFPLKKPYLRQLGKRSNPFVRRLALGSTIETPCGRLVTFSVHLGITPKQNSAQLALLRSWVADISESDSALIGGDFNASETTQQIIQTQSTWQDTFRAVHPHADGTTHELRWPWGWMLRSARLDYIFLRQGNIHWKIMDARHLPVAGDPHSDHRIVLTRLMPVS